MALEKKSTEKDSVRTWHIWRKWSRSILDDLFTEAGRVRLMLTPDVAIEEMEAALKAAFGQTEREKATGLGATQMRRSLDTAALRRDAHHYAVDLFYKTYFPRKGAPPLSLQYLDSLLSLAAQGLNKLQIAEKLGAKTNEEVKKDADRIRKELGAAKKRYAEMASKIRKSGARQWKALQRELKGRPQR